MEYKQPKMSESDFVKKGSMVGNLDEMIENMTDVRRVPNRKPNQKPKVDYYISGRVAVDIGNGKLYQPRIDTEVSKSGNTIGYDIADIKEFPQRLQESPSRATNSQVDNGGTHSRGLSISQTTDNAKMRNQTEGYYKKYGDDFYEKMPTRLQEDNQS